MNVIVARFCIRVSVVLKTEWKALCPVPQAYLLLQHVSLAVPRLLQLLGTSYSPRSLSAAVSCLPTYSQMLPTPGTYFQLFSFWKT